MCAISGLVNTRERFRNEERPDLLTHRDQHPLQCPIAHFTLMRREDSKYASVEVRDELDLQSKSAITKLKKKNSLNVYALIAFI